MGSRSRIQWLSDYPRKKLNYVIPTLIRARTAIPLFEPHAEYEHKGLTPNVVFPCGLIIRKGLAYMYYGAADRVIGVATMKMRDLMRMLEI